MTDYHQLPPGWIAAIDPSSGKTYYANSTTGKSSWTPPASITIRAPPPPPPRLLQQQTALTAPLYQQPQQNTTSSHYAAAQPFYPLEQHPTNANIPLSYNVPSEPLKISTTTVVGTARALVNELCAIVTDDATSSTACPSRSALVEHELSKLTAGQIADLCYLQQQQQHEEGLQNNQADPVAPSYYTPVDPQHWLNHSSLTQRPLQEVGRLHTRLHALRDQLKRLQE